MDLIEDIDPGQATWISSMVGGSSKALGRPPELIQQLFEIITNSYLRRIVSGYAYIF